LDSEPELPQTELRREVAVHKTLLTILASVALIFAGTAATRAASANVHHKRIGHQRVAHPSSDITSFSSSSGLHIGVNHPPKNR
jgi:hypothetical protein